MSNFLAALASDVIVAQDELVKQQVAGRIRRAEVSSVSGIWVTCTDGTKAARLAGPYIGAGNEIYLGNVSDNPRKPAWVCLGVVGGSQPRILTGAGFVDIETISAGSVGVGTISVTGAALGDVALVSASSQVEQGLVFKQAWISGSDTVSFALHNASGSSINPSARSWYARVIKTS